MTASGSLPERLREAGLRSTTQRVTVLGVVEANPHSSTDTVIELTRHELPTISTQAVYDCLSAMTDAGLLRRIQPGGMLARYEARVADNHHHQVCRECGRISDVDCATVRVPCAEVPGDDGFETDECEVIYWGMCQLCSAAEPERL